MSRAAEIAAALQGKPNASGGWLARCCAHEDSTPSLSIGEGADGKVLLKCFAGCTYEAIREVLRERGIWAENGHAHAAPVADLAFEKGLSERLLRDSGFTDGEYKGHPVIQIDYRGSEGKPIWRRYRSNGKGGERMFWCEKGTKPRLFGLHRLRHDEAVIVVEGETDCIALWEAGFNAIGVPGAENWDDASFSPALADAPIIFVHVEPDKGGERFRKSFEESKLHDLVQFFTVPDAKDPCELHAKKPTEFRAIIEQVLRGSTPKPEPETQKESVKNRLRCPIKPEEWVAAVPRRDWAVNDWIPMGCVTLLAGASGMGKTLLAQGLASSVYLKRPYLDQVPQQRRVLAWFSEDDRNELRRRQQAIARELLVDPDVFGDGYFVQPLAGEDVLLVSSGFVEGRQTLVLNPAYSELRDQIIDYKADLVILDTTARLYGGNENDRREVTEFIAMLTRLANIRGSAILLIAHPAKAKGSEYSGSTAWEGSVRSRLFLSRDPPGTKIPKEGEEVDEPPDSGVRYLSRKKSNYSALDCRRLEISKSGIMVPEAAPTKVERAALTPEFVRAEVIRAVRELKALGLYGNENPQARGAYLPVLIEQWQLCPLLRQRDTAPAMRALMKEGVLVRVQVGLYSNRTPRFGLTLKEA